MCIRDRILNLKCCWRRRTKRATIWPTTWYSPLPPARPRRNRPMRSGGSLPMKCCKENAPMCWQPDVYKRQRFYMGDQSRNSKLHFGMGLYITNSIMEQHNGQLILENSKETGGAKVTMKLPCWFSDSVMDVFYVRPFFKSLWNLQKFLLSCI